ncbi:MULTISPECIES: hypothetical protein [Geobacillus]|uniref:Uncharacterized protein n=1 Tax=Geobacillus thermocatenulatus TaxID=33938 RepID=A0A226Q638_9BACL|nr:MULTISPECIES: hypothetical protein [Geobacillus]AST00514.1 hypothetical protein GT3921_16660 [Geobacillus thermocatenulatus]KLR75327.1 hypothetical protein ABH20_00750 [Geobacillus sp. T6]OXB86892.1 hypothetical protein B9L19_15590 [Geobacillus thermocatenulatus]RAN30220.1 hypothetical protein VC88_03265 [Geobacillus sp. A8]
MNRYGKWLCSLAVISVLLAGCGTKEHETTQGAKEEQTADDPKPSSDAPSSTEHSSSKETKDQTSPTGKEEEQSTTKEEQSAASQPTVSLSYQEGKQTVTKTATLQTSNNQHFSLYVLEGWALDAEEPGADVLLHGEAFARIRLLSEGETNYEQLAKEHAQAVDANAARQQTNGLPKPFADAVWYTAQADGVTVHVIASAQPTPMLLTVHAPSNEDVLGAVLAMVATLQKQ